MLRVCEIFTSIQGESTHTGRLCTLIRLAGCNLRCVWCDSPFSYAIDAGEFISIAELLRVIGESGVKLVEITGGEPLLQPRVSLLCEKLLDTGYEVMVETNGSHDISILPEEVHRIVDVKCPGSGSSGSFLTGNLGHLCAGDEVKFVLASLDDAVWAKEFCEEHRISEKCDVIFSPVLRNLPFDKLADWMVKNRLSDIRFGLQLHKVIWGNKRGV
ncbi:MAG: radical SAM protein [Chitinispirillia bacterium]|nr:radical SAM protein [Chitinispirillia bacterium]MCL2269037.1 radical SAM protein [Chitinispirillia bacterium]